jgi:predicted RNase H-like nuclease (RuvC/YqgF family)
MEKIQFQISTSQLQDIKNFCQLNDIEVEELVKKCFKAGYNIEKYGLLGKMGGQEEKWVEKEVIREKRVEIPVEVIKHIEVIKEVPVEVVKEVEVIKEVPVEKIVTIYDNSNEDELLKKVQDLETERELFSTKIKELEGEIQKFSTITKEKENIFQNDDKSKQLQQTIQTLLGKIREKDNEINNLKEELKNCNKNVEVKPAVFLRNSNLGDNLYNE